MVLLGKVSFGAFVAGAVLVGLVAHAGAFLLAFSSPTAQQAPQETHSTPYSDFGPNPVGVRRYGLDEAPLPITAWYPAADIPTDGSSLSYAYAVNMLGPDSSTAIGIFPGHAEPGAVFDLTNGPYPLVILSHGFAITASSYAWLAEHLASHGMVVMAPQHRESLDPGVLWRSTSERPAHVRAVLSFVDELVAPGGEFEDLIDSQNLAIAGHSYGGYTTLAAAGARIDTGAFNEACDSAYATDDPLMFLCDSLLPRLGDLAEAADLESVPPELWPSWADERVDAAVTMAGDAAMFGKDGLAQVDVPVMAIGGTADIDSPFEWGTRFTYNHVASTSKVEVSLEGAAHLIFAGECTSTRRLLSLMSMGFCSDPAWNRARAHHLVKHYVTAFLLAELSDDRTAAAQLAPARQQISDVSYRAEGY